MDAGCEWTTEKRAAIVDCTVGLMIILKFWYRYLLSINLESVLVPSAVKNWEVGTLVLIQ